MTSYRFDVKRASAALSSCITYVDYRDKCITLVTKWCCLLDYEDLEAWFESNRCCVPIALSRILDPRIIKHETEYTPPV